MKITLGAMVACAFATVLFLSLTAGAAAFVFVRAGIYDVSANKQHLQPVYGLLQAVMNYAVKRRANGIATPALDQPLLRQRGARVFIENCQQCHGAPGIAADDFAHSLQPLPGSLVDARKRWLPRELFWITRNGVKMSAMPAWEYRLSEDELWAVVSFLELLPTLSVQQFASLAKEIQAGPEAKQGADAGLIHRREAPLERPPDPQRGLVALHQHGCNACHVIPGVTGSDVHVGPPLAGIAKRQLIAGTAPNNPEQMARWLRDPKSLDEWTAMPALGVSEQAARDMAAYLATLN